jgi:hypothetical protein
MDGWERTYELSDDDALSTKARRILCPPSPASSIPSPKAITSSATLFFLSFFARRTRARSASGEASSRGEPTKTMTRCREFLFCRCLSASCAIAIAVGMDAVRPRLVEVSCTAVMIWPSSFVCVTSTSGLIRTVVQYIENSLERGFYFISMMRRTHAPLVGHGHDAHCVLWIGINLGLEHGRDCICECAKARGLIIAVSHVL